MIELLQKWGLIWRRRFIPALSHFFRKILYGFLGMKVGRGTLLPKMYVSWPHQVKIGNYCKLEHGIHFKFDGLWQKGPSILVGNNIFIGSACEFNITKGINICDDTLIASGCKFIDHDHGMAMGQLMGRQYGTEKEIFVGNGAWLGVNVIVLKGAYIGEGAVIAAGSVVRSIVPAYEIWGGIPAKKIGSRPPSE